MAFKDRATLLAYKRLQRSRMTEEQRERERERVRRSRELHREKRREYDRERYVVHEMKRNTLREPQTIAARRAALRWDRLYSAGQDARRLEMIQDAREAQLQLYAQIWFNRT